MRFELFDGPRSLGTVAWERQGRIRLRIRDEAALAALVEHFEGEPRSTDADGSVVIPKDGWSPQDFEEAVLRVRGALSYQVVARPSAPEDGGPRRAG